MRNHDDPANAPRRSLQSPFEPGALRVLPCLITTALGGVYRLAARSWALTEIEPEPARTIHREGGRLQLYDPMDEAPQIGKPLVISAYHPHRDSFTLHRTSPVVEVRIESVADRLAQLAETRHLTLNELLGRIDMTPERLTSLREKETLTHDEEERITNAFKCTPRWLVSGEE